MSFTLAVKSQKRQFPALDPLYTITYIAVIGCRVHSKSAVSCTCRCVHSHSQRWTLCVKCGDVLLCM